MSLNDLLIPNKKKSAVKPKIKVKTVDKPKKPKLEKIKKVELPKLEKQKLWQVLGLEPSQTIFTFDEFEIWFKQMANKLPYFKAYIKQAEQYHKKTDIIACYFSALFFLQHKLNSHVE